jgi:hypothetical protein
MDSELFKTCNCNARSHSQDTSSENNPLSQFLTPEAMLTPGVAGSLTMMITNALTVNFAMPRAWVGLGLSFVCGLLVLVTARNLLQKAVFYVLNSLVIFCVAAGTNGLGAGAAQRLSLSLTTTASAQDLSSDAAPKQRTLEYCSNLSTVVEAAQKANQPADKILELVKPCQIISKDLLEGGSAVAGSQSTDIKSPGKFFSPWKF